MIRTQFPRARVFFIRWPRADAPNPRSLERSLGCDVTSIPLYRIATPEAIWANDTQEEISLPRSVVSRGPVRSNAPTRVFFPFRAM